MFRSYRNLSLVNCTLKFIFGILGLTSLLMFSSCDKRSTLKRRIKREVTKMVDRPLNLSFKVDEVWKDTIVNDASFPDDCYRIVTFIPVKSCTKCVMKVIPVLDSIRAEMNKNERTKLIVITDANVSEVQKVLSELNVNSQVYIDKEGVYLKNNNMTNVLDRNKTLLIDNLGKIVLVGEPYYNPDMKKLYLSVVSK